MPVVLEDTHSPERFHERPIFQRKMPLMSHQRADDVSSCRCSDRFAPVRNSTSTCQWWCEYVSPVLWRRELCITGKCSGWMNAGLWPWTRTSLNNKGSQSSGEGHGTDEEWMLVYWSLLDRGHTIATHSPFCFNFCHLHFLYIYIFDLFSISVVLVFFNLTDVLNPTHSWHLAGLLACHSLNDWFLVLTHLNLRLSWMLH